MRKFILTAFAVLLSLNFEFTAAAATECETAVSEAQPIEISEPYEYEPSFKEGGLIPTVKVEALSTEAGEFITLPGTGHFGANEAVPAVREDDAPIVKYLDMGELYQSWFQNSEYKYGYPDYVCGVWTETGDMSELVVAVTKDEKGEAGKEEILSLIENDNTVKFVYQIHSYTELRDIQEELSPLMADNGVYGLGVDEMNNRVNMDVDMNHPNIQSFMEKCYAQYGDRVYFEAGSEIVLQGADGVADGAITFAQAEVLTPTIDLGNAYTIEETLTPPVEIGAEEVSVVTTGVAEEKTVNPWVFVVCAAIVFAAGILFLVGRSRARQTTAGTIIAENTRLSQKDTERLVSKSVEAPDKAVFEAVMKEIE